jgi:hypothetical protein
LLERKLTKLQTTYFLSNDHEPFSFVFKYPASQIVQMAPYIKKILNISKLNNNHDIFKKTAKK